MSDLPEGWAWSTVADVLANGFFADGDWVETKDQDPDGEIRLLQLADVGDGFFRDRSSRFVNVEAAERLTVKPVEPGDVLVARMPAPLGRACIAPDLGQPAITVVDVCILRPDAGIDRRWLMWALNSPVTRAEVASWRPGCHGSFAFHSQVHDT
jgi:type I restriction enzyme S subunit